MKRQNLTVSELKQRLIKKNVQLHDMVELMTKRFSHNLLVERGCHQGEKIEVFTKQDLYNLSALLVSYQKIALFSTLYSDLKD